jgi:hypothetical protein
MTLAGAVVARIDANPNLTVHEGKPAGSPPYVVVQLGDGRRSSDRMVTASRVADLIITTHSVGMNVTAARIVRRNVVAQLLDHVLVVPGWQCWPIVHDLERAPADDESTGLTVVDAIDQWRLHAERTNEPE